MHPFFFQNLVYRSRIFFPPEAQLRELVHEVVAATTDGDQVQQAIDVLQEMGDDPEHDRTARELGKTQYSGLGRLLPQNRTELLTYIGILLVILQLLQTQILASRDTAPQFNEQAIVQELKKIEEHLEHLEQMEQKKTEKEAPAAPPAPYLNQKSTASSTVDTPSISSIG